MYSAVQAEWKVGRVNPGRGKHTFPIHKKEVASRKYFVVYSWYYTFNAYVKCRDNIFLQATIHALAT